MSIFPKLYRLCEWTTYDLKEEIPNFQISSLECSSNAQPCSSISWEQNGYYTEQEFLRVSEENVRWIQERFERSPCKSIRRASRELGIPQPTVWRVLRRRLLYNWVHLFVSPCVCVCVCVCVYMCVCVCIYVCVCVYIHIAHTSSMWMWVRTWMCLYAYTQFLEQVADIHKTHKPGKRPYAHQYMSMSRCTKFEKQNTIKLAKQKS